MALSFVGSATGTNSHGLPVGWAPGDIAVTFAYRDGSNTAPTLPGTFAGIVTGGANTNSSRSGARILQSGDTTFTWTNATSAVCLVYRAIGGTVSVGASARGSGSSSTITYPAITLQDTSGPSWVLRFAGHRSTNVAIETVPSGGFTYRNSVSDATDEAAGFDTAGGVTSMASGTAAVGGTASGFEAHTIELHFHPARDALTFKAATSAGDSSLANTTIAATAPTVAVGDLEVIWAWAGAIAPTAAPTLATPAGWNLGGSGASVPSAGGAVNTRCHLFWRISPDTGSSATLDAGTNAIFVYARESYSNPDPTSPFRQVVFGSSTAATSVALSSLNAVKNSLLSAGISQGAAQNITPPGSMTERVDNATYGVSAHDETVGDTGATGTRTFSMVAATETAWGFAEFQGVLSASAIDLLIANAAHGHAVETVALTSATALAIDGAAHAHTAQGVTLGTETVLAASDASHSHQADGLALSTESTLIPASAFHAHAAEAPTLSTATALVVADASHAHAADGITLSTLVTMVVADASQAHTAESITLATTSGTSLTVADAQQTNTADAQVLTTSSTLATANAAHTYTADSLSLNLAQFLAVQDASQANTAQNIDLSGIPTLSLADAVHANQADAMTLTSATGLTVQDAAQAHSAEAAVLSTAMAIAVANAAQSHTAGALTLSIVPALLMQDALHGHTADGVQLSADAWLEIAAALHSQLVGNLTLSETSIYVRAPAGAGFDRPRPMSNRSSTGNTTRARSGSTSRPAR